MKISRKVLLLATMGTILCCSCERKNVASTKGESEISDSINKNTVEDVELKDINDVRNSYKQDFEEAKNGEYPNLTFRDLEVVMPEGDVYNLIKEISGVSGLKGKELAEQIRKDYDDIVKKINEVNKFDERYLIISFIKDDMTSDKKYSEKLLSDIETGKYDEYEFDGIFYICEDQEPLQYIQYFDNYEVVQIAYGTSEISDEDIVKETTYYKYSNENNLNDKYKLEDGQEVSIQEVIDHLEEYYNDENSLYYNEHETREVNHITVQQKEDGVSRMVFTISNSYNNMLFETRVDTFNDDEKFYSAMDMGLLTKKFFVNDLQMTSITDKITNKGEAITEVVSLKDALILLSESLGEQSVYDVKSIEFGYREMNEGVDEEKQCSIINCYPVWRIESMNQNDKKTTKFYINAVTGDIEKAIERTTF